MCQVPSWIVDNDGLLLYVTDKDAAMERLKRQFNFQPGPLENP